MSKRLTIIIWVVLLLTTFSSLYLLYKHSQPIVIIQPDFTQKTPFLNIISGCPADINVNDLFVCISKLVDKTSAEADTLANKLITQSSIRLREITSTTTGPVSFQYGGADFLRNLPDLVRQAQKNRKQYISSVCNLDQLNIFGGSGMDLEREACRQYYTKQYLNILKNLEGGLTAE